MSKIFKSAAKIALPIAGFAVGGPVGAAIGGGLAGGIGGGGIKGIATGAALGGLGGGALSGLGSAASGLGGAAGGASGGGGGGLFSSLLGGAKSLIGSTSQLGAGGMGPQTPGSGILGAVTRPLQSAKSSGLFSSLLGGGAGGGGSSGGGLLSTGLDLFSNYNQAKSADDLEEIYRRNLSPYSGLGQQAAQQYQDALNSGQIGGTFSPSDLTQDPGYKFNLDQGQQALDRAQAARGGFYSGAALKEGQAFSQGLADQTYNSAYNRFLQDQQNKQNALQGGITSGLGSSGALADAAAFAKAQKQKSKTQRLGLFGNLLGGLGGVFGG